MAATAPKFEIEKVSENRYRVTGKRVSGEVKVSMSIKEIQPSSRDRIYDRKRGSGQGRRRRGDLGSRHDPPGATRTPVHYQRRSALRNPGREGDRSPRPRAEFSSSYLDRVPWEYGKNASHAAYDVWSDIADAIALDFYSADGEQAQRIQQAEDEWLSLVEEATEAQAKAEAARVRLVRAPQRADRRLTRR